jgi:DNA-binding FadR family transcriptional regulator
MRRWAAQMGEPGIFHNDFVNADLGLHLAIAHAAQNPFFVSISTLIEVALVAMMTVASPVENPERLAISVRAHHDIVDAIARRDANGARGAMQIVVQSGIDGSRGRTIRAPGPAPGRAAPPSGRA